MDAARVERLLDQLSAWGLVEVTGNDVQPTRKWSAKLQAAAEKLNLIHAKTGVQVAGNPLVVAASQALANENLGAAAEDFDDLVRLLVMLELSRMTPAKRAQLGFPDVLFEGEKASSASHAVDY